MCFVKYVYLLEHAYEKENGADEIKTLGIFSEAKEAEKAVEYYKMLPGFRDYPDSFCVNKYEINQRCWESGFGV